MSIAKVNHWRSDPHGWVGAAIMLSFGGIAFSRWQTSSSLFFALTCLRDVAAAWFLLTRYRSSAKSENQLAGLLAYVSSAMPFVYSRADVGVSHSLTMAADILAIVGFTLSTIALFELGKAFGVAPARRDVVRTGVYGIFHHPMYVGYGIAELGQAMVNPLNIPIFLLSSALYATRAHIETRVLVDSSD